MVWFFVCYIVFNPSWHAAWLGSTRSHPPSVSWAFSWGTTYSFPRPFLLFLICLTVLLVKYFFISTLGYLIFLNFWSSFLGKVMSSTDHTLLLLSWLGASVVPLLLTFLTAGYACCTSVDYPLWVPKLRIQSRGRYSLWVFTRPP